MVYFIIDNKLQEVLQPGVQVLHPLPVLLVGEVSRFALEDSSAWEGGHGGEEILLSQVFE